MSETITPERQTHATGRAWLHDHILSATRTPEFRQILHMQRSHAIYRSPPPCACCIADSPDWVSLYRCFHCGLWLCAWCAPAHFPETSR